MSSQKKKARRAYSRQLAKEVFSRSAPSTAESPSSSPPSTMSLQRDSSPQRGRPVSPLRGPSGDHSRFNFTSSTWKPPREYGGRHRLRSRSRSRSPSLSPSSDRRRLSERDEAYDYAMETRRRESENYRPRYDDDAPARPPMNNSRRE
jgi:hypothetical protein